MPDILNVDFDSATSVQTHFRVTEYSLTPRTDACGTHVHMHVRVTTGSATALGIHSTDQSYGRVLTGTINGHSIGTHVLKQYNVDRWVASTAYNYTVDFDIPYSPGAVYCNLRVEPQGSGAYMTTSTFTTGTNAYTVNSGVAAGITPAGTYRVNGATSLTVATMAGTATLTWTAGTGQGPMEYVFFVNTGSGWVYKTKTSALTINLNLADWASLARGGTVWVLLRTQDGYSYNDGNQITINRAELPTAPTSVTVPTTAKYNAALSLSWTGAAAVDGTISSYRIQVRRKAAGSSTWSSWVALSTDTASPFSTNPSTYTAWTVRPGDRLQYQVFVTNSYVLESAAATASGEVLMKGGIMRPKISGSWREGTVWIKVAGVWKEASSVYQKISGVWKESI